MKVSELIEHKVPAWAAIYINRESDVLTVDEVFNLIEAKTGITREQIIERTRKPAIMRPRQYVSAYLHVEAGMSLKEIGRILVQHHTSVMHSAELIYTLARQGDEIGLKYVEIFGKDKIKL